MVSVRKIILFVLLALCACNYNAPPSLLIDDLSSDRLNKDIVLEAPIGWNTFRLGDAITLSLRNISSRDIVFDSNFGRRIFIYDDGEWKEVKDQISNFFNDDIVVPPISIDPTNMYSTSIFPILDDATKEIPIKIFIIGNIYEDGQKTDIVTGAYIDITLKP